MATKRTNSHSLFLVIIISFLLAVSAAGVLLLWKSIKKDISPVTYTSLSKTYEKGEPERVIEQLNKLPVQERGTSVSLLWYGKSWFLTAWKKQEENKWRDYGKNSDDWFEGREVEEALHFLKQAARDTTTKVEATFYISLIYMQKGWYEKAEKSFKGLFRLDKDHKEGLLNYGVLQSRQGKNNRAEKFFLRGIELYPDEPEYYKNLFWLYYFHEKEYEKAVQYGDQYLKRAPRGDVGILRVKSDLMELLASFPEYRHDSLFIVKSEVKNFTPRKRR